MKICHIYGRKTGNFVLSASCDMFFCHWNILQNISYSWNGFIFFALGTMRWKIEVVWCEGNAMQLLRWWLIHNCAGNIRSPHDDTPLCHQWQVIYTSDIVGRFDALYRPSHSVSYQTYTGFYCVLFSLHTQLFILGFLLLLTRWKWSIYRICEWLLPNRNRAQ